MPKPGEKYRHYKGGLYEVIALGRHSETLEELVIYRSLTEPEKVWARPAGMWDETVTVNGEIKPRFALLDQPEVQIVRSDRKTLSLRVMPDGSVQVRAPKRLAQSRVDAFVRSHQAWIETHRVQVLARQQQVSSADVPTLKRRAEEILPGRVAYYAKIMGVTPKSVRVTAAKTRFGSCGAENTLNFSCYLMLHDMEQIDYVVVHELAHILHKNHGKQFYAQIEAVMPDYRLREAKLRGRQA